jgi:hypothetical protein
MAVWRYRVAQDDAGKLHFVFARYRPEDMQCRCGLIPTILNEGRNIEDMRQLARQLLCACKEPVIPMTEHGWEDDPDLNTEED